MRHSDKHPETGSIAGSSITKGMGQSAFALAFYCCGRIPASHPERQAFRSPTYTRG